MGRTPWLKSLRVLLSPSLPSKLMATHTEVAQRSCKTYAFVADFALPATGGIRFVEVHFLTGRERILAAFRGEEPDFIPFTPNIWQWFYYHQTHHSLPPPARMAGRNSNTFFPRSIRADGRSGGPLRWTVGEWRLILQPGRHIQNR